METKAQLKLSISDRHPENRSPGQILHYLLVPHTYLWKTKTKNMRLGS